MTLDYPPKFIEQVKTLIEQNIQNDSFGIHDLSESFSLSTSQIYRKIKKETG